MAAEKATANLFRKGALVQGAIVPEAGEDVSKEDAKAIRLDLDQHLYGADNAGKMPLINRALKFVGWQMNNVDAQFLENRQFQIEEIARWFGVPPFLLMQLEKQTSWGTGLAETNRNFAQYVLLPWCKRIEERLSVLLPQPRWVEFDMAGLEAGSAKEEITLLMQQVNGGFMTLDEARKVRNLPPLPGGDLLRIPSGVMLQEQLEASAAATVAATEGAENQQEGESGGAQVTA
jgi:HK97 family phage portal protein